MAEYANTDNVEQFYPSTYETINPGFVPDTSEHAGTVYGTPTKPTAPPVKEVSRRAWLLGLVPTVIILSAACAVIILNFVQLSEIRKVTENLVVEVESLKNQAGSSQHPSVQAASLQNLSSELASLQELKIQVASLQDLVTQMTSLQNITTQVSALQELTSQVRSLQDQSSKNVASLQDLSNKVASLQDLSTQVPTLQDQSNQNVASVQDLRVQVVSLQNRADQELTSCNVARLSGVTCTASSEFDSGHTCENVYDGYVDNKRGNIWITNTYDKEWIQIRFPRTYTIYKMEVYFRCYSNRSCSAYELTFSDGSTQYITRACGGRPDRECGRVPMETFDFFPRSTTFVNITCTEDCGRFNERGLDEVRLFSDIPQEDCQ